MMLFFAFYCVAGVIAAGTGAGLTLSYLGFILTASLLIRSSVESEKSGWDKLSRALPHTVHQRVGANYLFWLFTLLAMMLSVVVSGIAAGLTSDTYNGNWEKLLTGWAPLYIPLYVFWFGMALVSSSIALVIRYSVSGPLKSILISVAFVPSFYSFFLLAFSGALSGRTNMITSVCKPKNTALIIISAFLLFAASYFISVIIEAKSGREKLKAVKAAAAVLTVAALVASGAAVYALDKDGAFEKTYGTGNLFVDEPPIDTAKESAARSEMLKLAEHISGKVYTGMRTDDFYADFESAGFGECLVEFKDFYDSDKSLKISPVIYGTGAYTGNDVYADGFQAKADISANVIESNNPELKAREIDSLFPEGMSETDAVRVMKENGFCPFMIREVAAEEKACRTYSFSATFTDEARSTMSMSFDIVDGAVCNKWNSNISGRYGSVKLK